MEEIVQTPSETIKATKATEESYDPTKFPCSCDNRCGMFGEEFFILCTLKQKRKVIKSVRDNECMVVYRVGKEIIGIIICNLTHTHTSSGVGIEEEEDFIEEMSREPYGNKDDIKPVRSLLVFTKNNVKVDFENKHVESSIVEYIVVPNGEITLTLPEIN